VIAKRSYGLVGPGLIAGAVLSALPPNDAAAQGALEEIVVTARRRAESIQDVPVTITVFDEAAIEAAGIRRPQDFISLTPNVTLVETQNQGTSFITIRGISQARNSEPSVAVLVDGVLMSNPAQFTQELFDVQQIEVLKGAQGAVYGRNAIGGAIVITTREPGDEFEGRARLGYDDGPGVTAQIMGSGPIGDSETLKYHAALSHYDTDGWIENTYLGDEADPFKDQSARLRLIWDPTDRLRADARLYYSEVKTQALYFNIVGPPMNYAPLDVNDTSLPVRVNNPGRNDRELSQVALKLDYDTGGGGTLTSITSFDSVEEILTGDQYDFLPIEESISVIFGGEFDLAQSQFLDVETISQELRFTSPADRRLRWIAGGYMIATDRFISTGNIMDLGEGAFPVYRTPRGNFPLDRSVFTNSAQVTFLADEQDNFAWALFGEVVYDITDNTEISVAMRYDEDTREQTTLTPQAFLDGAGLAGTTGSVRKETWDELQPRITLRYAPSDNVTLFGGYSKGFRSGGFNQTGVGSAGVPGVGDLFDAEIAETLEFGIKSQLADGRVNLNFSVFDTEAEGSYFFVFLPESSTQNLGSLDEVDYRGFELDVTGRVSDNLELFLGYGATDSEIRAAADPSYVGNQAPLVSEDTINAGAQYTRRLGGRGLELFIRGDYQRIGDTWWEPRNETVRNPVNLLDWRIGLRGDSWSLVGWQRNFNDVRYNAEYSPGGFVFKAKPRRWGIDFTKEF